MKHADIMNMSMALTSLANSGAVYPVKFAKIAARNIALLAPITQSIQKAAQLPDGEWFQRAQQELQGISNARATGAVSADAHEKATTAFQERYPNFLQAQQDVTERMTKALEGEEEVQLFKISEDDLPEQIAVNILSMILPMVTFSDAPSKSQHAPAQAAG